MEDEHVESEKRYRGHSREASEKEDLTAPRFMWRAHLSGFSNTNTSLQLPYTYGRKNSNSWKPLRVTSTSREQEKDSTALWGTFLYWNLRHEVIHHKLHFNLKSLRRPKKDSQSGSGFFLPRFFQEHKRILNVNSWRTNTSRGRNNTADTLEKQVETKMKLHASCAEFKLAHLSEFSNTNTSLRLPYTYERKNAKQLETSENYFHHPWGRNSLERHSS